MRITEAFSKYGATLKNVQWSVSSENDAGELIVSLWKHYFGKPKNGKIKYNDHVSRWSGHGNTEFRRRIDKAFSSSQLVRVVIARTDDEEAVGRGEDASKLNNTFFAKEDWVGKVILWDGDNYEIEFIAEPVIGNKQGSADVPTFNLAVRQKDNMIEELRNYYSQNGILSTSFTCEHKEQCQDGCTTFTGPKSAFISSGYEAKSLPRLLFLSLDSGSGDKNNENRLPLAVRQQAEIDRDFLSLHKHKHWYRTHELAWYIFKRFDPDIKIQEARKYFAHANSAKCCMNNAQRKKANAILFKNCKKYLHGELLILSPEILITQGKEAKEAIWTLRGKSIKRIDEFASIIELNGKQIFWLHTYHPNNWGAFNKQRNFDKNNNVALGWVKYSGLIHEFIQENV